MMGTKDPPKPVSKRKSCCARLKTVFSLSREGASPINWPVMRLIILALFGSSYSITFLFPFLPDMVLYFGYREEEKGYYSGYIASSMFAGRIFGSFFWGWMSDRYGRRPILLVTILAVGITHLGFGFARAIPLALAMRFLNGLFNGLVGTCKTVLYEISDDSNQAVGMSAIALAWGLGVVLGPLISGYLAEPAKKYPEVFAAGGFFDEFPFILPSAVAFIFCLLSFFALCWKLPETLQKKEGSINVSGGEDELLEQLARPSPEEHQLQEQESLQDIESLPSSPKSSSSLCHSHYTAQTSDEAGELYGVVRNSSCIPEVKVQYGGLRTKSLTQVYVQDYDREQNHRWNSLMGGITGSIEFIESDVVRNRAHGLPRKSASLHHLWTRRQCPLTEVVSSRDRTVNKASNENLEFEHVDNLPDNLNDEHSVAWQTNRSVSVSVEPPNKELVNEGWRWKMKNMVLCKLMRSRDVCLSILLYVQFSFAVIGWEEVFVVWASTATSLGGLGFRTDQIGSAIGAASAGLLLIQVYLYPKMEAKFGALKTFQGFGVYLIFVSTILPALRIFHDKPLVLWPLLLILTGVQKIAVTSCFSSSSIFINNSVIPELAGSMNGISMTFSAAARTLAPTVSGSLFAWSITEGAAIGFPFDVNFVFIIFGSVYLSINLVSAFMPKELEKQKKYKENTPS